jgi:hypothetical protein
MYHQAFLSMEVIRRAIPQIWCSTFRLLDFP